MATDLGRLLIVSPSPEKQTLLAGHLQEQGYTTSAAPDGEQALDTLDAQPFDLMLLDVRTPKNPYQVLKQVKTGAGTRDLPIIMLGTADSVESVARCLEMGAEDYLQEPFSPALAGARVGGALERRRLRLQVQRDGVDRERVEEALRTSEKYERDVQIGRQIQASFLPETLPQPAGWEIAARFQPARDVAGDWYDAFPLTHGRIGLVLADVCDKGVGAALFMALMRSLIRAYSQQHYALRWLDAIDGGDVGSLLRGPNGERKKVLPSVGVTALKNAIELTNNYIANTHGGTGMFATMFFGILDPPSGRLTYVNGGHEAPVILDAAGAIKARLGATGLPVGVMPDAEFGIEQIDLRPGDILFSYTDGVPEARDPDRAFFTEPRLLELMLPPAATAAGLLDRVLDNLSAHIADADQFDDITMLALRRAPDTDA